MIRQGPEGDGVVRVPARNHGGGPSTSPSSPPSRTSSTTVPLDVVATPPPGGATGWEPPHRRPGALGDAQVTRSTLLFCLCAAVNSANLGYDIGVSTNAGRLVQSTFGLSVIQREVFLGSMNFWSIFGSLGAHYFTDRYGRRYTFLVAAVGFIVGVVLMAASPNYAVLMVGRFFVGLGVGVGLAIDPLYIAEVTPPAHRGELVTWSEIALNVGLVLGFSTGLTLSGLPDNVEWRIMFLLGAILPVGMIVLVFTVMPESPRWLVAKERRDEAENVLRRIYPPGHDVTTVVDEIREALEREEEAEHAVGWKVLWSPTPAIRRMLLVGVGIAVAQQAVGIDAIQYYLLDVLQQSGIENEAKLDWTLIFLGLIKLSFILVGGRMFDRRGRRPPFFLSLLGTAASTLVIGAAFLAAGGAPSGRFVVGGLAFYLAFFSIGMGPGAWLIPSEVFASCIRAKAMSVATFANRVTATLMASTFLSTANAMGWGGFFLMLSAISGAVLGFVYAYLPETKGKSLEEMSLYFAEITNDTYVLDAEAKIVAERRREVEMRGSPSRRNDSEVI